MLCNGLLLKKDHLHKIRFSISVFPTLCFPYYYLNFSQFHVVSTFCSIIWLILLVLWCSYGKVDVENEWLMFKQQKWTHLDWSITQSMVLPLTAIIHLTLNLLYHKTSTPDLKLNLLGIKNAAFTDSQKIYKHN